MSNDTKTTGLVFTRKIRLKNGRILYAHECGLEVFCFPGREDYRPANDNQGNTSPVENVERPEFPEPPKPKRKRKPKADK